MPRVKKVKCEGDVCVPPTPAVTPVEVVAVTPVEVVAVTPVEVVAVTPVEVVAKRKPSPYIRFCSQEREKVKKDLPSLKFTEIGRELGKRWKALTPEQKSQY